IKFVKLELTSSIARDELLNSKKDIIGYIAYNLNEYLAPANVLLCSKCMGLDHFKKQCTPHSCSKLAKCIHYGLDHIRDLLPDNQSGFREGFRLQTRFLLFLGDIYSLMSKSAPVNTVFVDFRAAFDKLWFLGCIGKLRRLGIPKVYLDWIEAYLDGLLLKKAVRKVCDMGSSLTACISQFLADDLAEIVVGQLGIKYSSQCLDFEKRLKVFLDHLEY
ncbi:unnamed protein product, partial [Adineta steineri]